MYASVCVRDTERERERDLTKEINGIAGLELIGSVGGGYERMEALLLR